VIFFLQIKYGRVGRGFLGTAKAAEAIDLNKSESLPLFWNGQITRLIVDCDFGKKFK